MDYRKDIKEYYSAVVDKAQSYSGELPYSPEEELLTIKKKANARRQAKLRSFIAAAAGVAAVAIGISTAGINRTEPVEIAKTDIPKQTEAPLPVVSKPVAEEETVKDNLMLADAVTAQKETVATAKSAPQYTHVPQITLPPMEKIEYDAEALYVEPVKTGESYVLDEYYALASTMAPEINIKEQENIASGSAMMASDGEGGEDNGTVWSEEEYFEYLGKNPLEGLNVPEDLIKAESEEKYILRDENGNIINDRRTFSYANEDRTRLLNVTTSKSPISDAEYESTDINGVRVSVFDNHMSNTALLETEGLCISAEMYGLEEDELMGVVYSLAERMAL